MGAVAKDVGAVAKEEPRMDDANALPLKELKGIARKLQAGHAMETTGDAKAWVDRKRCFQAAALSAAGDVGERQQLSSMRLIG